MWFIGVEVQQETSAPTPKKILDPPLFLDSFQTVAVSMKHIPECEL